MSDHKKTAELRVTREATSRYEMRLTDMQREVLDLQGALDEAEQDALDGRLGRTTLRRSGSAATSLASSSSGGGGGRGANKENSRNGSRSVSAAPSVEVSADLGSLKESQQSVRDVLLRANLLGLMGDDDGEDDDGMGNPFENQVGGGAGGGRKKAGVKKSASTSVLSSGASRRRLRPQSAGRSRRAGTRTTRGGGRSRARPKSAARLRR